MNELNLPEQQLRSWPLRQPAAALGRKLLEAPTAISPEAANWYWRALAPTLACALVAFVTFGDSLSPAPRMSAAFDRENGAVTAASDSQTAQNHWASVTFDWTNRSDIQSSMRFQPITNFSN